MHYFLIHWAYFWRPLIKCFFLSATQSSAMIDTEWPSVVLRRCGSQRQALVLLSQMSAFLPMPLAWKIPGRESLKAESMGGCWSGHSEHLLLLTRHWKNSDICSCWGNQGRDLVDCPSIESPRCSTGKSEASLIKQHINEALIEKCALNLACTAWTLCCTVYSAPVHLWWGSLWYIYPRDILYSIFIFFINFLITYTSLYYFLNIFIIVPIISLNYLSFVHFDLDHKASMSEVRSYNRHKTHRVILIRIVFAHKQIKINPSDCKKTKCSPRPVSS